jgi:DNA-binding transcriptional regulator LsrR (DeoR family)
MSRSEYGRQPLPPHRWRAKATICGLNLRVIATAATLAGQAALALTGAGELGDQHRVAELGDRTENLPHQLCGRRVVGEAIGLVGGD